MRHTNQYTAVLYFTRSAREEAKAKTFCERGNFAQNRAIAEKLIGHTYRQLCATGLRVRTFTTTSQKGHSFGERLGNAFQSLFDEGFENVIAVGNDCPQLSCDIVKKAAHSFENNDAVAGPAVDGGVYLLGMNKSLFQRERFCSLAWETDHLLEDLNRYAEEEHCSIIQLDHLTDIDNEQGLQGLLAHSHPLLQDELLFSFLLSICSAAFCYFLEKLFKFKAEFTQSSHFYRGPPFS